MCMCQCPIADPPRLPNPFITSTILLAMDEESLLTETNCFFRMRRTSMWSQVSYDSLSSHSILLNPAAVRPVISPRKSPLSWWNRARLWVHNIGVTLVSVFVNTGPIWYYMHLRLQCCRGIITYTCFTCALAAIFINTAVNKVLLFAFVKGAISI